MVYKGAVFDETAEFLMFSPVACHKRVAVLSWIEGMNEVTTIHACPGNTSGVDFSNRITT